LVTTVIQLPPNAPVKQASEMLKPFLSKHGLIQDIIPARSLLIRDTRQNIIKIGDIIATLQNMGPSWKTAMIPLHQADALKTASKVMELYTGLIELGQMGEAPVVLPVEWSGAIMVAGTPDQIKTVRGLVRDLDNITEKSAGLKIYPLKNARAEAAADVIGKLLSDQLENTENSGKESALVVSPDKETNSILVLADPQTINQVDDIIDHLDQPLAQVFVEALIVETTLEHSQDFGVEWLAGGGGRDGIGVGGFIRDNASGLAPLLSQAAPPVAAGGFTIGALGNSITYAGHKFSTLGALVSFVQTARDFNILSTPQLMTLDNTEAEVFIGENRKFETSERLDEQSRPIKYYEYRDVGIRLKVTPTINTETGMIRLEVLQEVQNYDSLEEITMNRNTRTNVQLPSGSTMVISGLIQNSFTHSRNAVPGLSRLPGFGWMFRREVLKAPKSTLMVFLSARIIETLDQADDLTRERMDRVRETRKEQEEILEREFWGTSEKQKKSFNVDMNQMEQPVLREDNE
ncbi:MAG: secretin N-terminal domain-containing protein, partial [Desulfonatronovibrio sp.]